MARLVAVDYDPFASQSAQPRLTPVDYDPFAPTLNARASGSAGAVNKKAEAIWGGSFDDWKKRKEADDAERARMVAESEAGNVGSRRAQEFQRETATLAETGALRNKPGEFNFGATGQMMRAGAERAMGGALRFAGESAAPVVGLMDAARNPEAFVRGTTDRGEIPSNAVLAAGQDNALANAGSELAATGATRARRAQPLLIDRPDDAFSVDGLKYYAQQGAISAPQLATTVAAGYLGGPAAALLAAGGSAFGTKFADARDENQDFSQAASGALVTAANEAIPEMLPAAAALGKLSRFMPDWMADGIVSRLVATGVAEGSTEGITEVANIAYETFGENKPMDRTTFVNRVKDAVITGGLAGSMVGAVTGTAEYGQARDEVRDDAMIRSLRAAIKPSATTARILGPTATPDAAAGAQIADDAFRAAGVGTVAASDMAEQDALARDLDAAQRDQLSSEAEIDRLLTGGINAQAQARSPRTVLDGQDAGRASASIPGFSGSLPAGVRTSYPGDSAESGSSVGFVGDGSLGSRNAPAPQQFTELANGTIFVPGDPVQLRQRAADAGFDVRGLAETRNGVLGVRFGTGAKDQIIGLFGGADPASAVEQSQPSALPEAAAVIAPPALDAKRTYGDTVFDERAHDLLDFIALNGGLDRTALESEGIDPANWNSRAAKGKNDRFFGKPLFRKSGGMSLETLREKARDAGFRTDKDVLDLIGDSLGGRKTFTPAGSEYQTALADVARQEADAQARQQRVNALPPSVPETDADAYIASRETEFDAPADRDGTDIADIESTLASVADTSPQQRASVVSLGHDYTAKLIELKRARAAGALNPDQQEAYIDLLEQDRETGKVAGRPMVGIGNKTAYVDALMQGKLMPVQVFLDADNFKALNDKFGHDVGDDAIRLIADVVRAEFGDGNVFHRGGDEFLTQGMTQDEVDAKMARVQSVLANYAVDLPLSDGRTATLPGIGVSYGTGANEKAADDSLKQDKQRRKEAGLRFDRREGDGVGRVGSGADGAGTDASGANANPQDRTGAGAEGVGGDRSERNAEDAGLYGGDRDAREGAAPAYLRGRDVADAAVPAGTVQSIRAAISQALGPKFLARLDNQKWFQIVDTVADLPPDVRKSITGEGVAGFVLPDGRVFIVAEGAAANPVGVTLHELGVHYGMTGILGEDFAPTLAKFKRLRAKDDRVGRAYERATDAADKDANGELTEAAKATLDEEALAYFVEENWQSPDTRGIVAKVIDAIKRLLNRLGMPLSMVNASPELLREVAIGAARMAADGRVSVGKDGALVYARDLLGEAPSETAQLVAQWKAKVDAKLRGDGRAYVKPSEGPGDLFGGPAEETADLFAKPQQRAQGTLFSRKRDNSQAAEDRALDSGDLEGAVRIMNRRIADQREALGDISNGVILKMEGRDSWAIVMPDVEGGGKWRMQMFDRRGFVGHRTRNSRDAALDEALQDKYTTRDDGALDEIQDSPEFVRGNFIAGEMMQLNAGKITSAEFDKRIADYDSSVKVVAKYSRTTQTGRIRKTVAELTNAADSMGSWRDWYDRHDQTLRDVFGDDAELFQKLLSATSQAASAPANIGLALKAYRQLFSGEPFTGYLPAVIKNLERVAENVALRGQKISEYGSANEGNADAIAVDRHIAMLFFGTKSPNRKQVAAAKNRIRAIAERLGWQPREVQAALWAYNQTLLGTAPEDVKSYDKLIEASRARIDALRAQIGRGGDRGARETSGTDGRAGAPERDAETGREQARAEVGPKYSRKADGGSVGKVKTVDVGGFDLPLNPNGTVTLYHHTNEDAAAKIRETGILRSAGEPTVYVTTEREPTTGYGDAVVAIEVDPRKLSPDDEFPGGRVDFSLDVGRPGGSLRVKIAKDDTRQAPPREGLGASGPKYSRRADTIEVDGKQRPTTDSTGKAIHPTEEGVRKFWEWFGESKVVDESAVTKARTDVRAAQSKLDFDDSRLAALADTHPLRPIITRSRAKHAVELDDAKAYLAAVQSSPPPVQVFHGGGGHIDSFRRKSRKIWLAESVAANTYAASEGGAVYPLYARIENPMTFDAEGATWQGLQFEGERVSTDDLADIAESRGHDGLIINNLRDEDTDDGGDTPATHYAVLDSTQVKSAIGNSGTFSPTDARIAYSRKTEEPEGLPPPVAIESHLSNMLKLRAFFDSAVDVMARQPGLKPLADAVRSYFDNVRRRQGLVNEVLRAPVKAASKADLDAFERYQYALQNNLRDDAAEELAGMTDKGRALVSAWEKIAKLTNDENQKVGVQVFDPKIGGWRKIGTARNFFPRVLKPKFQEAMRQPHKYPTEWNRLVRILLDAGRIQSAEDAQEFLNTAFSNESAFEYFAGIEKARMEPLPRDLYDYSMDAAIGYKDAWADRLSQIEAFGQKIGQGDQAKDKFDEVLMTVTDDNTRNYVTRVRERITNTNSKSPFYKFMANMNTLVTGLMLGNPATAALNIVGGLSNNAMVFPIGPNLKALKELRNLGAGIRDAVAKGVLIDDYMGVSADAAAQGVSERLSNLTQGLLNWGGYNGTEYINRVHSMLVGKHFLSDSLAAINKNPRSRKSLLATAFLQRNGFDVDTLAAESTKPADERPETNKFLRFASNLTQGSYKIDQTPIFVDEPIGKFLFKYQKFGTQINRVFYQQMLRPFAQSVFKGGEPITLRNADGTEAQERVRNFAPLLRFIAAAIPGGMLVQFIREALFGYGEDGPDEDEIRRKLADGETAAAAAMLAERAFIAITALGAGGFLGNYMQTAKDFQERQRFKNPLDPPGLAPVKSFANFVMKLNDQGKITLDDIEQEIQNNVSLYRTGKRLLSSGINMVNDESVTFAAREVARREHNHVRYMARRYADSVGIEAKRRAPSEIAATANTPTNRAIKDALLLGDGETARALAAEYVASFDNAYDAANALASIRNSIRLGQPALVQLAPSETERRRFMRWAFSNLTPEGYARIKDTDEKYRKAAASSGLWKPESDAAAMKRDRKADESKAQWSDSQRNSFLRSKGLKR